MKRRAFVGLFGAAVVAWPLAARAQQPVMPVIGFLSSRSAESDAPFLASFKKSLQDSGFTEGQTVRFEYRRANNRLDRLPTLAAELIALQPTIIATGGGPAPPVAAKQATSTIAIVFVLGSDPVRLGLVSALNRPGGTVTGVSILATAIVAKRLDLLHAIVPNAAHIAILVNPNNPDASLMAKEVAAAERALGLRLQVQTASTEGEIEAAFANFAREHADALLIGGDAFFNSVRLKLIALSARNSLPSIFDVREFAKEGGLMSYGASQTDAWRQAGTYAARILKGEKPGDLPILQPTSFELVINLKTAKTLGLAVPPNMLLLADEVIE